MDIYFASYFCKNFAENEMVPLAWYIFIGGRLVAFNGASLDGNIKYWEFQTIHLGRKAFNAGPGGCRGNVIDNHPALR